MTVDNTGSGEVFIVDDDPLVLNALSIVLSRAGYQVKGFAEGVSFLADANPESADVLDHQSVDPGSAYCADLTWKNCWNTFSAAGAAAVPPWPPFSISAQTTSSGSSTGP